MLDRLISTHPFCFTSFCGAMTFSQKTFSIKIVVHTWMEQTCTGRALHAQDHVTGKSNNGATTFNTKALKRVTFNIRLFKVSAVWRNGSVPNKKMFCTDDRTCWMAAISYSSDHISRIDFLTTWQKQNNIL